MGGKSVNYGSCIKGEMTAATIPLMGKSISMVD